MVGTISNIVAAKGFGFILSGDNNQEYFFHHTEVLSDWEELVSRFVQDGKGNVTVTFEPVKTPKGPRAKNVTLFKDKD